MDIEGILEGNCWSLICSSVSHGDDSSVVWLVVSYHMAKPYSRVIGVGQESGGIAEAIKDAQNTTKDSIYEYQYEYKGE